MVKLAWLCWDEDDVHPTIWFTEPESWRFSKIVQIVYFEVEQP